jgi:hypothetical protein
MKKMSREISAILTEQGMPISMTLGNFGSVDFDIEAWIEWHKQLPQNWHFFHSHPAGLKEMSSIDEGLVRTLVATIYPYKIYFWVITETTICWYECQLEKKEDWIARKEKDEDKRRKILINLPRMIDTWFLFAPTNNPKIVNSFRAIVSNLRKLSYGEE